MDYVDIGRRIRLQRENMSITQSQLAQLIDVTPAFVGHLERGVRRPSLETLVAIANALDVSLDYLLASSMKRTALNTLGNTFNQQQMDTMQEMLTYLDAYVRNHR